MNIVEHFLSLSGEAPIIGEPTYIYRFTGCNLNCTYCDTMNKNEINFLWTEEDLIYDIKKQSKIYPSVNILFTGGEPLLNERKNCLLNIIKQLPEVKFYIETNGSVLLEKTHHNCHFVCDYKSPSSGEMDSFNFLNIEILSSEKDCIKFVITKNDLEWLKDKIYSIKKINSNLRLYVSPVYGQIELQILAAFILQNKLPVIMSIQLHKLIWPGVISGV